MSTLIVLKSQQLGDQFFHRGDEVPPGLVDGELLDWQLDHKLFVEAPSRRSLYKLLAPFSGAKESEQLTIEERKLLCL